METSTKKILQDFNNILNDLNLKELEDLQDLVTVKIFRLTDTGERISLDKVKKDLNIRRSSTEI
ncbi:MAG TPA: hypothetical protein DCW95_06080 [Chryseobacterium sp.]|nr:hypothetical protein [Chryseobacterium sp.]